MNDQPSLVTQDPPCAGSWLLGVFLAFVAGTGCLAASPPGPVASPSERPTGAAPPSRGAPAPRPVEVAVITDVGVGDVRVGAPLPVRLLSPGTDPISRFVLGFHADGQTHDGFRLPGIPVRALMEGSGPFTRWFDDPKRKEDPPPDASTHRRLAEEAVREARAGTQVGWIVVDGPGVRTASGIGVGSTFAEVMTAHPAARLLPQPPTFGKDECVATLSPLTRVQVYFSDCRSARAGGRVTRVTISSHDKK